MPEEPKENKAKKLAAARKKLKEYQQRGTMPSPAANNHTDSTSNSGHVSSNISEISEASDIHLNGSNTEINQASGSLIQEEIGGAPSQMEISSYFTEATTTNTQQDAFTPFSLPVHTSPSGDDNAASHSEGNQDINAIQVLITEKAQLTSELNKYRTAFREKELELEEIRVQHGNVSRRVDDLQHHLKEQQKQAEQHRLQNAELQHKLAQARAQNEEQSSHLLEVQQQIQLKEERLKLLDNDFKEKCNELELAQLRIRQLSDENNISKDNRVETLTQTQFMYEQQIRDLQAMVQQLTVDKDQANTQYQTYVQQLNAQVNQLNERNNELTEEYSKLQEREKQMVDHVQQMEKEIQKNILRQSEHKEEKQKDSSIPSTTAAEIQELQERVQEFETERYEFQLKIKSQEDRLHNLQIDLQQKQQEIDELREHLENITSEQPDKTKLLATMESDKVAASRALSQNVELKKQLDELELRFVQLTNDKADLMNRLDAEQHANRNYSVLEQRLRDMDERFKFKDEEMIRLCHENEELKKKTTDLQWRLKGEVAHHSKAMENHEHDHDEHEHGHDHHGHDHDHHKHDHGHDSDHHGHGHDHHGHDHDHEHHGHDHDHEHHGHDHDHHGHDHDHHEHDHDHDHHGHDHDHHGQEHDHQGHNHDHHGHDHGHHEHDHHGDCDVGQEAKEVVGPVQNINVAPISSAVGKSTRPSSTPEHIATEEAVEKLQNRFTQLMSQVADLTEEKQRLEHLVMQLQSETETIGEYIALYQTQRRILKEREYEKAAQTALLQSERQQMRERLTMLNNLVNSLGMEIPITQQQHQLQQQLNEALAQSISPQEQNNSLQNSPDGKVIDPSSTTPPHTLPQNIKDFNSMESQQILHKIQDIITEIKENTKELPTIQHSVDHLNCCSGKFEVV